MDWEAVNGIVGIVSAVISALSAFGFFAAPASNEVRFGFIRIRQVRSVLAGLIASSGWALCCLCYLWIAQPFGSYISDNDIRKFYGIVLALPSFLILFAGLKMLNPSSLKKEGSD